MLAMFSFRTYVGPNSVAEGNAQRWFKKFRSGGFNLEDAPRSDRPNAIRDDDLKVFAEVSPSQTVYEIAEGLGVRKTSVTNGLEGFEKGKKLEKWSRTICVIARNCLVSKYVLLCISGIKTTPF